ncbi:MAG TPA: cyclic nucleotide-binding domain-containing protein [Gaiellaceae bacterium]|nr:cyclic nucleotide-binding domain-containing protein [Gaiellaceae bacterium]
MRLGGNQKIDLIRKVPLFARCSRAELKEIALLADEIDLHEGKEMTREGAPGREFFVLLDGTADVKKNSRRVNTLGPGDFFGEIALVSREPRTATVIATSPVRALVITDRSFRRLLDDAPQVQTKVMEAMAERLAPETL